MNPDCVPADLVRKAESVETTYMYDNAGTGKGDSEERLRAILAAVLPEVQKSGQQIVRLLYEHDSDRMECTDHDGMCCPAGDAHGFTSRYAHQAEVLGGDHEA